MPRRQALHVRRPCPALCVNRFGPRSSKHASQLAISEASSSRAAGAALKLERDVFVYRSYIASGKPVVVLDEVKAGASDLELELVRLHAELASGKLTTDAAKAELADKTEAITGRPAASGGALVRAIAATLANACGDHAMALSLVRHRESLEQMALEVASLLAIDRADLAGETVATMRKLDDEAPLAVLAGAWVNQSSGRERANDAAAAFLELIDKFGPNQQLLAGLGAACMAAGRFEDAQEHLVKAASSGPASPAVLANLIACSRHTGKPAETTRRLADELERDHADTPLAQASATARAAAARACGTA